MLIFALETGHVLVLSKPKETADLIRVRRRRGRLSH
jgi:hypothetical protein